MVSKLHKLAERRAEPHRLMAKDAHDVYRLLVARPTGELARALDRLGRDGLAAAVTGRAIGFLDELFASPGALGATMAGDAERGVGAPATVAASVSALASDLLAALER